MSGLKQLQTSLPLKKSEILLNRGWTLVYYKITFKNGMCVIIRPNIWVSEWRCASNPSTQSRFEAEASLSYPANPGLPLNQKFAILSRVTDCQLLGPSGSTPQPALGLLGHVFVPGFYVSAGILSQVPVHVSISHTESGPCARRHFSHWAISAPFHVHWELKNSKR